MPLDYATGMGGKELRGRAGTATFHPPTSGRDEDYHAKSAAALRSNSTCRMSAMRRRGTCKQTGRYC